MTTEYYLQKKTFNSWSHVTWYATEEECRVNFKRASVEGNGYSWRMVKAEVLEEKLLADPVPVLAEAQETVQPAQIKNSDLGWGAARAASGWGKPLSGNPTAPSPLNSSHGMVGKVWLGNPTTKEKKRVEPSMVDAMMKEGWVKAGPRTVL